MQTEKEKQIHEENKNFFSWVMFISFVFLLPSFLVTFLFRKTADVFMMNKWIRTGVFVFGLAVSGYILYIDWTSILAAGVVPVTWLFLQIFDLAGLGDPIPLGGLIKNARLNIETTTFSDLLYSGFAGAGVVALVQNIEKWAFKPSIPTNKQVEEQKKEQSFINRKAIERKEKRLNAAVERQIQQGKTVKQEGVLLGVTTSGRQGFVIPPDELNKHTFLVGTTGAGKTTTIKTFVEYALQQKQALLVIDGKGDPNLAKQIEEVSMKYGRPFYAFNTDGTGMKYNPLSDGTPSELTDKMLTLSDWSEEHYKLSSQRFLQLLFRILNKKNIPATLRTVNRYCSKDALISLLTEKEKTNKKNVIVKDTSSTGEAHQPQGLIFFEPEDAIEGYEHREAAVAVETDTSCIDEESQELIAAIESIDNRAVEGLASRLSILAEGDLRSLFVDDPAHTLEIHRVLEERAVAVFSLDSLRYPDIARQLGKLVVNDIKANVSKHARMRRGQRVSLIFDEFNVFASEQVVDVINKSRDAGFEALIAVQSLADLVQVSPNVKDQILENSNTLIVHRQNNPLYAEELANAIGTKDDMEHTFQTDTEIGMTGLGTVRNVKKFHFHPDDIKRLNTGEAIVRRHTKKGVLIKKVKVRNIG